MGSAVLEVGLNHPLLREGLQVVVAPSDLPDDSPLAFLGPLLPEVLPIVIYAISRDDLSDQVRWIPVCDGIMIDVQDIFRCYRKTRKKKALGHL